MSSFTLILDSTNRQLWGIPAWVDAGGRRRGRGNFPSFRDAVLRWIIPLTQKPACKSAEYTQCVLCVLVHCLQGPKFKMRAFYQVLTTKKVSLKVEIWFKSESGMRYVRECPFNDQKVLLWKECLSSKCQLWSLISDFLPQLKILVEEDMYKVAVDGTHLLEYEHRVGGMEDVTLVRVCGDVALYSAAPSMIWDPELWNLQRRPRSQFNILEFPHGVFEAQKQNKTKKNKEGKCHLHIKCHLSLSRWQMNPGLHPVILDFFYWFHWLCSQSQPSLLWGNQKTSFR